MPKKKSSKVPSKKQAAFLQRKFGRYKVSPKQDRTYDDIIFDSKWELNTYKLLKENLPQGTHIHRQVPFLLQPKFKDINGKGVREINYIADFVISDTPDIWANELPARSIVIDSKGHLTDIFKIKNKMFMFKYNRVISQVKKAADVLLVIDAYRGMQ